MIFLVFNLISTRRRKENVVKWWNKKGNILYVSAYELWFCAVEWGGGMGRRAIKRRIPKEEEEHLVNSERKWALAWVHSAAQLVYSVFQLTPVGRCCPHQRPLSSICIIVRIYRHPLIQESRKDRRAGFSPCRLIFFSCHDQQKRKAVSSSM